MRSFKYSALISMFMLSSFAFGQELQKRPEPTGPVITAAPGKSPNSNATYQALRNVGMGSEGVTVNNFVLKRDAGTFTFKSGTFTFLAPVNGKVTGAVFQGEGTFNLDPPIMVEKRMLFIFTRDLVMHEDFNTVVLRFTDGTYQEIKKAGTVSSGGGGAGDLKEFNGALKSGYKIRYNLHGRILQDVLSEKTGGLFYAYIRGKKFGKLIYVIDPHGIPETDTAPEEVAIYSWSETKGGVWASFHFSDEYKTGIASGKELNGFIDATHHKLDTQIERNAKLTGDATTTFISLVDDLRVVPLNLFPSLRVTAVTGSGGEALDFIQEGKDDDSQFFVVLPKGVNKGESYSIRTQYAGKDAIKNEGNGNYFPVAREDWYPNSWFGDYAGYESTFHTPKELKIVANGEKVKDVIEGGTNITEWKTLEDQAVAGFNIGNFKVETKKLDGMDFTVETYANVEAPEMLNGAGVSTVGMAKKAMAEGELAVRLYTDYFGPTAFKHIAMTQQTAPGFGQAWPELVYLPILSFLDSTQRFQLTGGSFDTRGYFKVVAPHEVAHQWWGHTVGWESYRDQWMGEGFSETSASLFIQLIRKSPQEFNQFWKDEKELLTEKNSMGFRAIDAAPLTVGYRLTTEQTGDITRRLIYPKGAFILHMVRMMMYNDRDPKGPDSRFKETMHDFLQTYYNKTATTEDFKAMVEKHMAKDMDLDQNGKMDWFFDPYVYGTTYPDYHFESTIENGPNGIVLNFKLTQKNVDPKFKMIMPVYLELANGRIVRLGSAHVIGNDTVSQTVNLGKGDVPKRAMINYNYDVLCSIDGK